GRNNQIDGMRGFLAIFVLIHHAAIWHGYLLTGVWKTPSSNLLTNLGQVGVSFFFMITGYLFFSKIRSSDQDWVRLYISRFLRLTPMFIVSLCLVLLVIGFKSRWSVHVSPASLTVSLMRWAPFTALGMPNINGVKDSFTINAAVTWTLVYEWFFYFSLPVIAALFK
ncbi:TPA: acyltransferase family protein, partial [Shigella flexneri]